MKKGLWTLATAVAVVVALAIPVGAAELHEPHAEALAGDSQFDCKGDNYLTRLHFVNNQMDGQGGDATLYVTLSDGSTISAEAWVFDRKYNRNTQHWWILIPSGTTVVDASTGINTQVDAPGRLVISNYMCKKDKGYSEPA